MRYVVHIGTGTIMASEECVVVDIDQLSPSDLSIYHDVENDEEFMKLAQRVGTAI